MGEILQCHYQDPEAAALVVDPTFGPEADETSTPTRADFDDIDDYNGWIASPPEDRQGTPLDVDAKYERTVQVEFVDPSTPAALGTSELVGETGLKRITVTVASPDQSLSLVALRGSASSYDREPAVVGTFVRWVGVTLQLGGAGPVDGRRHERDESNRAWRRSVSGRRHRGRRGSVYVLMLALAMIVTVAGLGTLLRLRVDHRLLALEQDWHHGGLLAQSAVDQALCTMSSDRWWREVYKDNESDFIPEMPLGRGAIAWRLEDPVDGKLEDESFHPVRIHGLGRVGRSVRVYSVMTWPSGRAPRRAPHRGSRLRFADRRRCSRRPRGPGVEQRISHRSQPGPGARRRRGAVGHVSRATSPGASPCRRRPRSCPCPRSSTSTSPWRVEIKYGELSHAFGNDLRDALISPSSNPVKSDRTNPDGLYFIKVPNLTTLKIRDCRIEGTLLIELGSSSKLKVEEAVVWKSHRADFPALIVYTSDDLGTSVDITCAGELDEFSSGVNFNPDHTPYYGDFRLGHRRHAIPLRFAASST